jgi:hypothetical protein
MRIFRAIILVVFLFPVLAFGENNENAQYKFIKGKGIELCEAYYKNLILFEPRDIACERKFDSEFKEFKKPAWVKLNLTEHKELLKKICKFFLRCDQLAKDEQFDNKEQFEKHMKGTLLNIGSSVYFGRTDIDNDGKLENVVLYNDGRCNEMRVFAKALLVLNEDKTLISAKKTQSLLQNPFEPDIKCRRKKTYLYQLYDIFFYKNRTYFDKWNVYDDTLSVYELSHDKTTEHCKFKCQYECK